MGNLSFSQFNLRNGTVPLGLLAAASVIGLLISGQPLIAAAVWFGVLGALGALITLLNYRVWRKRNC